MGDCIAPLRVVCVNVSLEIESVRTHRADLPGNELGLADEGHIFRTIEVIVLALNGRLAAASMAVILFLSVPLARSQSADASLSLPDNPSPHLQQSSSQNNPAPATDNTAPAGQSSSTQATPAPPPETAAEQLKKQEHQRSPDRSMQHLRPIGVGHVACQRVDDSAQDRREARTAQVAA